MLKQQIDNDITLRAGQKFSWPSGNFFSEESLSEQSDGATPTVYRLRHLEGGLYRLRAMGETHAAGKILFAPAGLLPGETVEVAWVDENAACINRFVRNEPIELQAGIRFRMPSGNLCSTPSQNQDRHPETPTVYSMRRIRAAGKRRYQFTISTDSESIPVKGFRLFAPSGLKPGELVVVEWKDIMCAAVRRATPDELRNTIRAVIQLPAHLG